MSWLRMTYKYLVALGFVILLSTLTRAGNWPQWRGPANDGTSKETRLPTEWSPTKNIAWKLAMPGMGGSTPAVWYDRIFLTSADGDDLVLLCVSTEGKELWKRKLGAGGGKGYRGDEGNNASPSPSTDGEHVFAFLGSGDCACFDFDGNEVWKFNAQKRYGEFKILHGIHSTPLLHGDRLYLSLLHSNGMWLLAIDKTNGKEIWKATRKTDGRGEGEHSYASPCLWRDGKEEYMIVHGCDYTTAHRLSDGSEVWRLGDLNPKGLKYDQMFRMVASPVASGELLVAPTCKNGPIIALKPGANGMINAGSQFEVWRKSKGTPDVPSPLIHDGLVYLCSEKGILTCLEAKTGKELYQERLHSALYRGCPVCVDGKLYCIARDGTVSVVKLGPKFELLATNKLPDTFVASPAISNGTIYLRGYKALYAIR